MEIVFWNCQELRPKWKELERYLMENNIDVIALNETFLKPHMNFSLPGYDIKKKLIGLGVQKAVWPFCTNQS